MATRRKAAGRFTRDLDSSCESTAERPTDAARVFERLQVRADIHALTLSLDRERVPEDRQW